MILDNSENDLKSIKDIGDKIKIPFVNTPWDVKFINIGGKKMLTCRDFDSIDTCSKPLLVVG